MASKPIYLPPRTLKQFMRWVAEAAIPTSLGFALGYLIDRSLMHTLCIYNLQGNEVFFKTGFGGWLLFLTDFYGIDTRRYVRQAKRTGDTGTLSRKSKIIYYCFDFFVPSILCGLLASWVYNLSGHMIKPYIEEVWKGLYLPQYNYDHIWKGMYISMEGNKVHL
mmetsp:Transcript_23591/g.26165  ORF Transcript_23591/g.26165 Transcript_23591/m.26165 type:complete len:164 (+) Transcript_23591:140-631(+)|eukprot:CAMPEP_0168539252 /NCGR_PEP_ID=MMETSP0405-20121227/21713_1 /TAXON_ID=498012 /ORGANISM="Trichosphaerium sp, Strain Am-I-7 wt" /LENGTH=163 /DNA_ID=CAMNT_0008568771 /DNA_START=51 /DNA_END=542 /DNA_ORIENTATION=+